MNGPIGLGIGSGATVSEFVLLGLSPSGPVPEVVALVDVAVGVSALTGAHVGASALSAGTVVLAISKKRVNLDGSRRPGGPPR